MIKKNVLFRKKNQHKKKSITLIDTHLSSRRNTKIGLLFVCDKIRKQDMSLLIFAYLCLY